MSIATLPPRFSTTPPATALRTDRGRRGDSGTHYERPALRRETGIVVHLDASAATTDVDLSEIAEAIGHFVGHLAPGIRATVTRSADASRGANRTRLRLVDGPDPRDFGAREPGTDHATTMALARAVRANKPRPTATQAEGRVAADSPARRDFLESLRAQRFDVAPSEASISADPPATSRLNSKADYSGEGLLVDLAARSILTDDKEIELTYKEFELLAYLATNARRIVTREELMSSVWQVVADEAGERTIDVHIRRLRLKLGHFRSVITTVRGAGYRFDPSNDVFTRP